MLEILPVRLLSNSDAPVFGPLNISLGNLYRASFPVADSKVVSPPEIKLRTILEESDFGEKEVFEQSLVIIEKEIKKTSVPEIFFKELGKYKEFLLNGEKVKGVKSLWCELLNLWVSEIKQRLASKGFYRGIAEDLEPKVVTAVKKIKAYGRAYFDEIMDDVNVILQSGRPLHPRDLKKVVDLVCAANKKLFFTYEYEWVLDSEIKITRILPYTGAVLPESTEPVVLGSRASPCEVKTAKSAVKVFADLSGGFTAERNIDGVYIASEEIFDLNLPGKTFEQLVFRLVESSISFPECPVFLKLADKSEGMGKLRGALRLLHQKNLFDPLLEALDFARHKKGLKNIQIVIPFVRSFTELTKIKQVLAERKFIRNQNLKIWMEVAVPENLVNLEKYLEVGVDGLVLNLDELSAHLSGFDYREETLTFYKNEVDGLLKFLEEGIRILHKAKLSFIAGGNLISNPKILEYLVEKGVYGVVVGRFDALGAKELLYRTEKRVILKKLS